MVKYRQPIRPGDRGRDIRAVKRTLLRLHIPGSGAMGKSGFAGAAFVKTLKTFQRHHALHADGVYGKASHEKLALHFDAYSRLLYRTAKLRKPPTPPAPSGSAQANAKKLLQYHTAGKYRADNSGDLRDLQATAAGKPVWSQGGYWVHIDPRPLEALVWLIEAGHKIGTFAICSDHHYDGPHGHAGGLAIDISSINGVQVGTHTAQSRKNTLEIAELLHSKTPPHLHPWQLICDGYGYTHDPLISSLTIPGAAFYGYPTMAAHRNHLHLGYL